MKQDRAESIQDQKKRARQIVRLLRREYGPTGTFLNHTNPLQLLVATILSAQCTDKKVNEVTRPLFKKYRSAEDFARADQSVFEQEVRQTGFYRNKAKNIRGTAQKIVTEYRGKVPDTMEELLTLPGVARKTANIVLATAYGKAAGIAVDTHVKRLSGRLGLSTETNPDKIERDLTGIFPQKDWIDINFLLINHGRRICSARKPLCTACVLNSLCPSADL